MGLIEKYGTGIKRVHSMFVDYNLLHPRFELIPGGFLVTVFANNENSIQANDTVNDPVNDPVKDTVKDTVKDIISKNQKKILEKISENNNLTADELVEIVGINLRNIKSNISKLKQKGLLQRIGPDKGGYWKVML